MFQFLSQHHMRIDSQIGGSLCQLLFLFFSEFYAYFKIILKNNFEKIFYFILFIYLF